VSRCCRSPSTTKRPRAALRAGFTQVPAMRRLGELWDRDAAARARPPPTSAICWRRNCAPAASISPHPGARSRLGPSGVIGDRAFHRDPVAVSELAGALIDGLHAAGMGCCGKHFPGTAGSRPIRTSRFRSMSAACPRWRPTSNPTRLRLDGVMPAHVIYPQVDSGPPVLAVWLEKLRKEFGFDGVISATTCRWKEPASPRHGASRGRAWSRAATCC